MFNRRDFPPGFLFGAATAAYQIEGSSFGGAGLSHWDTFAATPGNVKGAESGAVACAHYQHWESDLDLLKAGGFDAYRFSTSWARVMPDGRTVNPEALDFYDRLLDGICARGMKPFLTLYHWDLPSALADIGGWANREIALRFADYAEKIAARLGDRVASIATLNEPWCIAWLSHFLGAHAPGLRDIRAAARAMHHVLLAHGLGVSALRGAGVKAPLGLVLNFEAVSALSDSPADKAAAARWDAIMNRWFIEAVMQQRYPAEALEGLAPHLPEAWQEDMKIIGQKVDFLGVNYYTRKRVQALPGAPWPAMGDQPGALPKTQLGWEIYPEGLAEITLRLMRDYTGALPLYITENGMALAAPAGDPTADGPRTSFIAAHLAALQKAMAEGAPVKGYFYWSLLDNYEWAEGYAPRFGLVHVDYESQKRRPKDTYHAFARALRPT